jgi:hypothetical protein
MAQVVTSWETLFISNNDQAVFIEHMVRLGSQGFEVKSHACTVEPGYYFYSALLQRPSSISEGNKIKY